MISKLPASNRIAVPWKNGGGVTREVAVFPADASMDDFDWRISTAEVTEAGPFSRFDGIDRHLTVLRGQLRLDAPDRRYTLFPLESLEFEGELPVSGTPLTQRVLDLNVMTRRGKVSAVVRQVESETVTRAATAVAIELDTLDAIRIDGGGRVAVNCRALLVEFTPG